MNAVNPFQLQVHILQLEHITFSDILNLPRLTFGVSQVVPNHIRINQFALFRRMIVQPLLNRIKEGILDLQRLD